MKKLLLLALMAGLVFGGEQLLPKPAGDKGEYYLLSVEKQGNDLIAVHKRVGKMATGFSKTRINCNKKQYQDLAYGEDNIKNMKDYDKSTITWVKLVDGSSKSYLVKFVCDKK